MIDHKYPYTNFEQLNIDFLLETTQDNSNKIVQLRTDLTSETASRIAEDDALTAFGNALQQDIIAEATARENADANLADQIRSDYNVLVTSINTEIETRENADIALEAHISQVDDDLTQFCNDLQSDINAVSGRVEALENKSVVIFHLSYGQGGVLDCLPEENELITDAFDTSRRAMAVFTPSGECFERISVQTYTGGKKAVFASITAQTTNFINTTITLQWVESTDTHTFNQRQFSLSSESKIYDLACNTATLSDQSTITYAGAASDFIPDMFYWGNITPVYVRVTTTNTQANVYMFTRKCMYQHVVTGTDVDVAVFECIKNKHLFILTIEVNKVDPTDPTTWIANIGISEVDFNNI